MQSAQHTIVLSQSNRLKSSRTFKVFDSVGFAMEGILSIFENKQKEDSPDLKQVEYTQEDLFAFLDKMPELVALVYANPRPFFLLHSRSLFFFH